MGFKSFEKSRKRKVFGEVLGVWYMLYSYLRVKWKEQCSWVSYGPITKTLVFWN